MIRWIKFSAQTLTFQQKVRRILAISPFSKTLWVAASCFWLSYSGFSWAQEDQPKTARIERTVKNNITQENHYDRNQVFFKRVETSFEGDTQVVRTYNAANQLIQVDRVSAFVDPTDSTINHREIKTKKYQPGSRKPIEVTVITESDGLLNLKTRILKERKTKTRIYSKEDPGTLLKVVTEEIRLVGVDAGIPTYEGTRTTKTKDGKVVEDLDLNTPEIVKEDRERAESEVTLPEEIEREVRASCASIARQETYGFIAGPFNFDGDWTAVNMAAMQPFHQHYTTTMREKKDGANYKFTQIDGLVKRLAYSTFIKAIGCNLSVIRNSRHFPERQVLDAKRTACAIRGYMAEIFPEEKAAAVANWKPALIEMDDLDPCN